MSGIVVVEQTHQHTHTDTLARFRKPAHLVLIVGEKNHVNHLMKFVLEEGGVNTTHIEFNQVPSNGPDMVSRITTLSETMEQMMGVDQTPILFCTSLPLETEPFEAAFQLLSPGTITVLVIETNIDRLEHEIVMPSAERKKLRASVTQENLKLKSLNEFLHRRHREDVEVIEHRRSSKAQVQRILYRLALKTGRRIPAQS